MSTKYDDDGAPIGAGDFGAAAARWMLRALQPMSTVQDLDAPVLVLPDDHTVLGVEKYMTQPARVRSTARFSDVASFVAYCELYGSDTSVVFAEPSKLTATALLDYHTRPDAGDDPEPSWCSHAAVLTLRYSDEFLAWDKANGRKMSQRDFVEFIEDNADDITDPDAATFLEIAKGMKVNIGAALSSHVNLDSGDIRFSFTRESRGKAARDDVDIPEVFAISVPVFEFGDHFAVQARLRYRAEEDGLMLFFKLKNPERLVRNLAERVMTGLGDQVAARVLMGSHEHGGPDR